jgi:hypothetical protein
VLRVLSSTTLYLLYVVKISNSGGNTGSIQYTITKSHITHHSSQHIIINKQQVLSHSRKMEIISTTKVCGGTLRRIKHASSSTKTEMTFAVFTPPTKLPPKDGFPALFWLSGLTCNDQNFAQKASPAFVAAANEGLAIVMPDTSPRGAGAPGEDDRYRCLVPKPS